MAKPNDVASSQNKEQMLFTKKDQLDEGSILNQIRTKPELSQTPIPVASKEVSPRFHRPKATAVPIVLGRSCQINKMSDLTGDKDLPLSQTESHKLRDKYSKTGSINKGGKGPQDRLSSSPSSQNMVKRGAKLLRASHGQIKEQPKFSVLKQQTHEVYPKIKQGSQCDLRQ